jgi:A/G-specific adenine glycosylase
LARSLTQSDKRNRQNGGVPDPAILLAWYDSNARVLAWRVGPGDRTRGFEPDPYKVWLSEIMLQQTTVAAVKPYFESFMQRWPDIAALANASRDDVMKAWAGLGYYARARNLKACAEIVASEHGGRFPETISELRKLPGIGEYTAAAISTIAFDRPAPVVDGNIERIVARLYGIDTPLPAAKKIIRDYQAKLTPERRSGDYAQALMDLGATICTPKRPACSLCPWSNACLAHATGNQETYPVKATKVRRPTRYGAAFVAVRTDGAILLRRRAERGLLGGMSEVPGSEWTDQSEGLAPDCDAPFRAKWRRLPNNVVHIFTHFSLELSVFHVGVPVTRRAPAGTWWSPAAAVPDEALPSVMKKAIEVAVPGATKRQKGQAA